MDKDLKIVIAVHFMLPGAADALQDYLVARNIKKIVTIRLPFHFQRDISVTTIERGKRKWTSSRARKRNFGFIDFFRDFTEVFNVVSQRRERFDIFVGFNNLNALCGLFLKKMGRVEKVIFYGIDFVPIRFKNKFLNFIYHKIEEICVKHCDEVWNVSPRMAKGREKFLGIPAKVYKQKVVPIGVDNVVVRDHKKLYHSIIFVGHILEKQGLQLVIEALPMIVKKVPRIKFKIIGGGEYEESLKNLISRLKLEDHVKLYGWVQDRVLISKEMMASDLGIACYKPEKGKLYNFTYYADPTKIKDYLSHGLPVITTKVPYNASEIEKAECGFIVEYEKGHISKAIINIYKKQNVIYNYQKNAAAYMRAYTWGQIFDKATKEII